MPISGHGKHRDSCTWYLTDACHAHVHVTLVPEYGTYEQLTYINTRAVSTGLVHGIPSKLRVTMQHLHCNRVTLQCVMSSKPEPRFDQLQLVSQQSSMEDG